MDLRLYSSSHCGNDAQISSTIFSEAFQISLTQAWVLLAMSVSRIHSWMLWELSWVGRQSGLNSLRMEQLQLMDYQNLSSQIRMQSPYLRGQRPQQVQQRSVSKRVRLFQRSPTMSLVLHWLQLMLVCLKVFLGLGGFYFLGFYFGASSFSPSFSSLDSSLDSSFLDSSFLDSSFLGSSFLGSTFLGSSFLGSSFLGSTFLGSSFLGSTFLGSSFLGSSFLGSTFFSSSFAGLGFFGYYILVSVFLVGLGTGGAGAGIDLTSDSLTLDESRGLGLDSSSRDLAPLPFSFVSFPSTGFSFLAFSSLTFSMSSGFLGAGLASNTGTSSFLRVFLVSPDICASLMVLLSSEFSVD